MHESRGASPEIGKTTIFTTFPRIKKKKTECQAKSRRKTLENPA